MLVEDHKVHMLLLTGVAGRLKDEPMLDNYFARVRTGATDSAQALAKYSAYSTGEHLGSILFHLSKVWKNDGLESDRVIVSHDVVAEETASITDDLEDAMGEYRKDFGKYPRGDNRAITRQLFGLNPKKKTYVYLYTTTIFDDQGNVLDLWHEPVHFTFRHGKPQVHSRKYDLTMVRAQRKDSTGERIYPPVPDYTKAQLARAGCYQLALGTRLLVQNKQFVPPQNQIGTWLFAPPDKSWPTITILPASATSAISSKDVKQFTSDPWGSPYTIHLSPDRVSVTSIHTSYVASEPLMLGKK